MKLPQQDNYCDCGLFLLAYIDYFTAGKPRALRLAKRQKVDQHDLEGALAPEPYNPKYPKP